MHVYNTKYIDRCKGRDYRVTLQITGKGQHTLADTIQFEDEKMRYLCLQLTS